MRFPLPISLCLAALPVLAQEPAGTDRDILRFENGDSLHGTFAGLSEGPVVKWTGATIAEPMLLQTGKLRRIALNGGRAAKSLTSPSFIILANGDRLPGAIVGFDAEHVTVETDIVGTVRIPREHVTAVVPHPHGGTVHYMGPFTSERWNILGGEDKDELALGNPTEAARQDGAGEASTEEAPWVFGGGAWYSNGQVPIAIDAGIPDQARISFHLGWRNRLSAIISFHSTLKVPEPPKPEDDPEDGKAAEDQEDEKAAPKPAVVRRVIQGSTSSSYPLTYGPSYVLTIYSSYAMLYRCSFNEDGQPVMTRLSTSSANVRLEESGEADFELRCDRRSASIALFVNGQFVSQWEDQDGYAGTGSHLSFACQNSSSRLRVSDVVVSSWNGMIDSARSMDSDKRDVVLLTNGTDRFSGRAVAIEDGKFIMQGAYAELRVPVEDVQEIRFARDHVTELPAPSATAVRVRLQPVGRVTVEPLSATPTVLTSRSPALGQVDLDLDYASILEFTFSDSILDNWDDDF